MLQCNIVDQLVIGALQKGRIDCHDRLEPFGRQTGGEGDGVLLGDGNVEVALGIALGEFHQS